MSDQLVIYRERVAGTNIDPRSLLSTDYFNHFNSVIMLFGMLPDAPDLLGEIDGWKFMTYAEHFKASGLDFADLAIEAYGHAPAKLRTQFESIAGEMCDFIEKSRFDLHKILSSGEKEKFAHNAVNIARELQAMVDAGGAVVHGYEAPLDQSAIDKLF